MTLHFHLTNPIDMHKGYSSENSYWIYTLMVSIYRNKYDSWTGVPELYTQPFYLLKWVRAKLNNTLNGHLVILCFFIYVILSLFTLCRLCCLRIPQLIFHYMHDRIISWINVTNLFPLFPHSLSDLWCGQV